MKYLFGLTLVACVALPTLGQTPSPTSAMSKCTLTRDQAPEIRGIRLGMSTNRLLSLFPEEENQRRINEAIMTSKRADSYGVGRVELHPDQKAANPRFAGVGVISIELIDERVTRFYIQYTGAEWKSADQFVAKLSDGLRLPSSSWEPAGVSSQMKCDGFRVEAYTSIGSTLSTVQVVDTSAPQLIEDRRETAKEKARQAFRP